MCTDLPLYMIADGNDGVLTIAPDGITHICSKSGIQLKNKKQHTRQSKYFNYCSARD